MSVSDRRKVTILSADMVGYSRMISIDPIYTVARLNESLTSIRTIAGSHGGSVFGSAGDSLMISFSEPEEAVECARKVQENLRHINTNLDSDRKVEFRIGIDIGEVIEGGQTLHGENVNVAVRLQEAAPPNAILISENVLRQIKDKVALDFELLDTFEFKNIAQPVTSYLAFGSTPRNVAEVAENISSNITQTTTGFDNQQALAVLPFAVSPNNVQTAYIADGFAEDLITSLSHLRWLPVINRGASFAFRNSRLSAIELGKELGVKYLLEGSLRQAGRGLRITTRLNDASLDLTIWSERYDIAEFNVLSTLDDIALQVAAGLEAQIERNEQARARARRSSRLNTWDILWRGRWHLNRFTGPDAIVAKELFDQAAQNDPDAPEVAIHQALWAWYDAWTMRRDDRKLQVFGAIAAKALRSDPLDSRGHLLVGAANMYTRNLNDALVHFFEALRLNPSSASGYHHVGSALLLLGRKDEALEPLLTGLKFSPRDADEYTVLADIAATYLFLGDWENAIAFASRSIGLRPGYWYPRVVKIGALARSGQAKEAANELAALYVHRPNFSREYINWLPYEQESYRDYLAEGLDVASVEKVCNI